MKFFSTSIPDVKILRPLVHGDERGFFMETYRKNDFAENCSGREFVQDNHSLSKQGTLRGLHYQTRKAQGKLVRVVQGEVFDVAVDMRKNSHTFGKWVGVNLSSENKNQLWIPEGFAHGFFVLSEYAELLYKCTDYYDPETEVCLKYDDPDLGIEWPFKDDSKISISPKDAAGIAFAEAPSL